jgi:methylenetetrahydrofolate reductase (NADPH)
MKLASFIWPGEEKRINNRFQESLQDKNIFSVTWELASGRGAHEKQQTDILLAAQQAAAEGKIHALTITDNHGGRPALMASGMGQEILQLGIEPLVHFTCKDKNRNQIESELYYLNRAGIRNLLVMTGDYPMEGFKGRPKPVFDLDPIHTLELINKMNQGLEIMTPRGKSQLQAADFYAGSVVSPFKAWESELLGQYYKLKKKINHHSRFIVTQLGYDARKFHEVLQYIRLLDPDIPVIANVYILTYGAARMMNSNQLPGSVVTDKLLAEIDGERSSADKGEKQRLMRAAKMYALARGMGYNGVHIGGQNIKYEQIKYIIETGEELSSEWRKLIPEFDYPQPQGFYYFEADTETGLNKETPVLRSELEPELPVSRNYRMMRGLHHLFFTPEQKLYPVMSRVYKKKKDPQKYFFEHLAKVIGNDCKDCGDCALLDLAYLCPMSQCPKNQRNGPCGGSYNGWCEVYPEKRLCLWTQAYAFLKAFQEEGQLEEAYLPPVDWELYQTSAWYNYYNGRDHSRLGESEEEE